MLGQSYVAGVAAAGWYSAQWMWASHTTIFDMLCQIPVQRAC